MRPRYLLALLVIPAFGTPALAQPRVAPTRPPAVSPYLNLNRPGNSPGVNYYDLVKPQLEFRQNIQNLQQQVTNNQSAISGLNDLMGSSVVPTTGHGTAFLNTGGYFSGGSNPQRGRTAPAPARRR